MQRPALSGPRRSSSGSPRANLAIRSSARRSTACSRPSRTARPRPPTSDIQEDRYDDEQRRHSRLVDSPRSSRRPRRRPMARPRRPFKATASSFAPWRVLRQFRKQLRLNRNRRPSRRLPTTRRTPTSAASPTVLRPRPAKTSGSGNLKKPPTARQRPTPDSSETQSTDKAIVRTEHRSANSPSQPLRPVPPPTPTAPQLANGQRTDHEFVGSPSGSRRITGRRSRIR